MWNSVSKHPDRTKLIEQAIDVLEVALENCENYDVRTTKLYDALDYLQTLTIRTWGFTLFKQGLEEWNVPALHEGLKHIKKHIGYGYE